MRKLASIQGEEKKRVSWFDLRNQYSMKESVHHYLWKLWVISIF